MSKPDPVRPKTEPEAQLPVEGYAEWLAAEIAAGRSELAAGEGISSDKVWKRLGQE